MAVIMLISFFLFVTVHSQCSWQYGADSLDLSPLKGRTITAEDNMDHTYIYTICEDSAGSCEHDSNDPLMCKQVTNYDATRCFDIGRWDPAVTPTYDESNEWQFEYANGSPCGTVTRTWAPSFTCNSSVELEWGIVSELFGSCRYTLEIETRYACPNWTTTTISPNEECIWKTSDGNYTFDISSIYGKALSISDNGSNELFYTYTPCSNSVKCGNKYAMTYLFNISAIECQKYLAIWEDGIFEPSYSKELGIWQFVYTNGESCDGLENILIIQWICDETVETAMMVKASNSLQCNYELVINSALACS